MTKLKRKWGRKRRPSFKKHYTYTKQDEYCIDKIEILQNTYTKIAKEIFGEIKNYNLGDWEVKTSNIRLFVDAEFGAQAEIIGTSKMELSKRLKIHINFLEFLKKGYSIIKAIELCRLILKTQ